MTGYNFQTLFKSVWDIQFFLASIHPSVLLTALYKQDQIQPNKRACVDPESLVRGGPTLTSFFFFF